MVATAPDWVSFGAEKTEGLDLLGLRAPVQRIGNDLFDGITTVTPKVRYLSVLTWIIHRYSRARLPNGWAQFFRFAEAQEAMIVLANRMRSKTILNLVGVTKADELLRGEGQRLSLPRLAQIIAYNIYATTSRQLHLTHDEGSVIGGLTEERGLKLADAFNAQIANSAYDRLLQRNPRLDSTSRSVLDEIADSLFLDKLPRTERDILIDAILPKQPFDARERNRLRHYALLLWLTKSHGEPVAEEDMFETAIRVPRGLPECLHGVVNDWLEFLIRDVLAVTHESVLAAVMRQIDIATAERGAAPLASDIVAALLDETEEHESVLRELKLLKLGESLAQLSFRELRERVRAVCAEGATIERGLRRWRGGLSEVDLYERALQSGSAAPVFLPLAWCLVAERISPALLDASSEERRILSLGTIFQIGLEDVILPKLDEFVRGERSVREVMAELITRTVQQHLRVAWTRFMPAQGKDVSIVVADGDTWARNGRFAAGRTDSRLGVAIGWLHQLQLINGDGLTSLGERILGQSVAVLDGSMS
jgi:hypothetical protein